MRRIPGEQPPLEGAPLREWLARLVVNINASLNDVEQNAPSEGGQVDSLVAGTNITIDSSDPINPIVSATFPPNTVDWWSYIGNTIYQDVATIVIAGTVYEYIYTPTGLPVYRFISDAFTGLYPNEDSYYSTFNGSVVSGLIVSR